MRTASKARSSTFMTRTLFLYAGEMEGVEVSNSQQIVCEGENGDQGREGGGGETAGQVSTPCLLLEALIWYVNIFMASHFELLVENISHSSN